jgi:hypothetical protein
MLGKKTDKNTWKTVGWENIFGVPGFWYPDVDPPFV